jgi:hypothetical protein
MFIALHMDILWGVSKQGNLTFGIFIVYVKNAFGSISITSQFIYL